MKPDLRMHILWGLFFPLYLIFSFFFTSQSFIILYFQIITTFLPFKNILPSTENSHVIHSLGNSGLAGTLTLSHLCDTGDFYGLRRFTRVACVWKRCALSVASNDRVTETRLTACYLLSSICSVTFLFPAFRPV
jgi:hypothetical protein